MKEIIKYEANDGKIFDSQQDCKKYENENLFNALTTLKSLCNKYECCDACPLNLKLYSDYNQVFGICFLKTSVPSQWRDDTLTIFL